MHSGDWKAEGFYLQNKSRRGGAEGEARGFNLEYVLPGSGLSTGLMYIDVPTQRQDDGSTAGGVDAWSLRADWAMGHDFKLSSEYVMQDRFDGASPKGWYLRAAYHWDKHLWSPEFSYRYAAFDGDDLSTGGNNERFATIAYGYSDSGAWYQGEIAGGYALDNSNLKSNMFRLQLLPNEKLTLNVIYYDFKLDQPNIFGEPVGSTDFGDEINVTAVWMVTDQWHLLGALAVLVPGDAASNWVGGGDKNWLYGLIAVNYSFGRN